MRMLRWAQGVSLKEHKESEEVCKRLESKLLKKTERCQIEVVRPCREARARTSPEKSSRLASTWEEEKRKTSKGMDRCGGRGFEKKGDEEGRYKRQKELATTTDHQSNLSIGVRPRRRRHRARF